MIHFGIHLNVSQHLGHAFLFNLSIVFYMEARLNISVVSFFPDNSPVGRLFQPGHNDCTRALSELVVYVMGSRDIVMPCLWVIETVKPWISSSRVTVLG